MTGDGVTIRRQSPLDPSLDLLFARHTADMHADTPPESIHMLPRADLDRPEISFHVLRDGAGAPLGMGALRLDPAKGEGEIKSMHVLAEHRGQGHSRRLLVHLLSEAAAAGLGRVSLETGVQPTFEAARALYRRMGFIDCGPFGDYTDDPNSVFMTRTL